MKLVRLLFLGHLAALIFGLAGLLIALPNPQLWAGSRWGADVYQFGMNYGGSLHIVLGAATMFAFGVVWLGWRRTSIFFAVTVVLSLSSELIGTGTGWPFGNYEYTSFLGYKVLDRVPFTIPLSWFYVGFAAYLLANTLFSEHFGRSRQLGVLAVLGGAWLLTVWDLVLDPAMAHESLAVKFWIWSETGPYFGMPIKNFVGWTLTAVLFMGISRLFWRRDPRAGEYPTGLPFAVYLVNTIFAMVISISVDLWWPVVLAVVLGVIPAWIAWRAEPRRVADFATPGAVEPVAWNVVRTGARACASRGWSICRRMDRC
jgi:uncharacterized membrane protein